MSPAPRNALDDGAPHRGLFVGHFVDRAAGLRHSLDVEVKWRHHPAGDRSATTVVGDWRSTLTLLVQGRFAVWVDGEQTVLERPGDYVIWSPAPARWHSWQALADSVMLTVRWPSGRDPHFAGFPQHLINTNSWTTRHLRRAASLKLVEMTAGTYWAQSAEILGTRRGTASRTLAVLRNQIPDDATWREFEAIVERIARTLDSNPERINYANRRRVLATWEMPQEDWTRLCAGIRKMGRMAAQNPLVGTLLVWSEVTQADHLQCPPLSALRQIDGPETRRVSDRVAQLLTPSRQMANSLALRHSLNQYAADLAAQCDIRTDPLSPT